MISRKNGIRVRRRRVIPYTRERLVPVDDMQGMTHSYTRERDML